MLVRAHPSEVDLRRATRAVGPTHSGGVGVTVGAVHRAAAPPAARACHAGVVTHALEHVVAALAQVSRRVRARARAREYAAVALARALTLTLILALTPTLTWHRLQPESHTMVLIRPIDR